MVVAYLQAINRRLVFFLTETFPEVCEAGVAERD